MIIPVYYHNPGFRPQWKRQIEEVGGARRDAEDPSAYESGSSLYFPWQYRIQQRASFSEHYNKCSSEEALEMDETKWPNERNKVTWA